MSARGAGPTYATAEAAMRGDLLFVDGGDEEGGDAKEGGMNEGLPGAGTPLLGAGRGK